MFGFLNTVVLPALAAIAIPLIIHLFTKRKSQKVLFSSLRFLKLIEQQRIRQVKLYQFLLILLRMLFILFLVLAFSRPTVTLTGYKNIGAERTTAVIILDNSYSMQSYENGRTLFDKGKDYLHNVLSNYNDKDQIFLLNCTDADAVVRQIDLQDAGSTQKMTASNKMGSMRRALVQSMDIYSKYPNANRDLIIISDFRFADNALTDSLYEYLDQNKINSFAVPVTQSGDFHNLSIDSVYVPNRIFELNSPVSVVARLKNAHPADSIPTNVNLYSNHERKAMAQAIVAPSTSRELHLSFVPDKAGIIPLQLELNDDDLLIDNKFYLSITVPAELNVLVVQEHRSAPFQAALQIIDRQSNLNLDITDAGTWQGRNFQNFDLILFNGLAPFFESAINRFETFLASGKNVVIIPHENQLAQVQSWIDRLATKDFSLKFISATDRQQYFLLQNPLENAFISPSVFTSRHANVKRPRFFKYYKFTGKGDPLVTLTNGDPFLTRISGRAGAGQLYILACPFDPEWTDFAEQGLFIPFVHRLLFSAAFQGGRAGGQKIGQHGRMELVHHSLEETYFLEGPDGTRQRIIPEQTAHGLQFDLPQLNTPGHYKLKQGDQLLSIRSVNVDNSELSGPFVRIKSLSPPFQIIQNSEKLNSQILQARTGREVGLLFFILSILALFGEIVLVKKIEGKSAN